MFVKSLELKNFRNYEKLNIAFEKGTNILYGDNAQGKTNILEAIFLCGTTKSHKGSKDKEMIQLGYDESHIRMMIEKDNINHKVDMHLKKNKPKGAAINGILIKKSSELFGLANFVFFSPEDLSMIKNGPGERRRFLDLELCQLDKVYIYNLTNYNKILNQRNNLLKQISLKPDLMDTLEVWDNQLMEYGRKIIISRHDFVKELNQMVERIHKRLTKGKEELLLQYEPNSEAEELESKLKKNINRDLYLKTTGTGPHRDDISFSINNIDVRKYGSQGQQRTCALSIKLAEIELVKKIIKNNPILLLDDVLSELDRNRQNDLLDSISGIQTIITCTGMEEFITHRFQIDTVYHVVQGTIVIEKN